MGYIDTSVLVAYYCPEPLSAVAQSEMAALATPTISRLAEVELYSAVALKVRTGELDIPSANRIVSQFDVHLAAGLFAMVTPDSGHYSLARDWIGRFNTPLRTVDALHLALAFSHGLRVLTSDQAMARSAAVLGVDHRLLSTGP